MNCTTNFTSTTQLITAPLVLGVATGRFKALYVIDVVVVILSHTQLEAVYCSRIDLCEFIGIYQRHIAFQFTDECVVQGFHIFQGLGLSHLILRDGDFGILMSTSSISQGKLRLKGQGLTFLDGNCVYERQIAGSRKGEGIHARSKRINQGGNLSNSLGDSHRFQTWNGIINRDDTRKVRFLQLLPTAVLHKVQFRHTGGIDVFPIKIDIVFILEGLVILGGVKAHGHHFGALQVVVLQAKGMKFFVGFQVGLTHIPTIFLGANLLTEVEGIGTKRNLGSFRKTQAFLIQGNFSLGLQGNPFLEHVGGNLEITIAIGKGNSRNQQQERQQLFKRHKVSFKYKSKNVQKVSFFLRKNNFFIKQDVTTLRKH